MLTLPFLCAAARAAPCESATILAVNTLADIFQTALIWALPSVLAITLHEAAHGWMAHRLGDPTARQMGRVTLNPVPHIDPVGTIALPLLLYLVSSGAFLFGYAKPVPVDESRLRHPHRDMMWVALAGPASNFLQALMWMVVIVLLAVLLPQERVLRGMAEVGVSINLMLWAFNLLPLPPLDGGHIAGGLLPPRLARSLTRLQHWGLPIVLLLLALGLLGPYWLQPLTEAAQAVLRLMVQPLIQVLL